MEFNFIRYRLVIDDLEKAKQIHKLIGQIIDKASSKEVVKQLPKFYNARADHSYKLKD